MSTDTEFTIRVTGAAPPSLPTKGKKKAASKKNTASQQQQRRYNMRLRPSTSIDQLRKDVYALFNIPTDHIKSYQMSFLSGFPPKELHQTGKAIVHELGIRPNESITIRFTLVDSSGGGSTAKQPTKVKQQQSKPVEEEETAAAASAGRQKRASAMAATASFKDVIAAQDAIMKNEKKKSPKRKTTTSSGNISGFSNAASTSSKKSKQPKKVKMEGSGYRLSDGKSFAGSSPSKKKSTGKQKGEAMFKSEDDVASKLLSSFGGSGGGGGNVSKYLRSAMKGAVTKSYEASRAAVRVTAVNAGEYSFEKVTGGSLVNGGTVLGTANDDESSTPDNGLGRTLYTVQYSKGMEGRGRYDEQVEIIGLVALKAVLNHVYDSSNGTGEEEDEVGGAGSQDGRLRPVMIAQLSPRAFWSLVFHCKESAQASTSPLSVDDMLRTTLPQLDWSHLERGGRKRVLSEKARENKRQTESTIAPDGNAAHNNGDQETMAIEQLAESALDSAMAGNKEEVVLNERERRAKAAMARFRTDERKPPVSTLTATNGEEDMSIGDDWTLVTPVEDDIDELIECILEGSGEGYDDDTAKAWATVLVNSVQNWRVLANSDSEYIKSILSKKDCPTTTVEIIQGWIDAAQGRALEEIMLEILDGYQDALDVLQDKAKSSSPRDLVFWKVRPEILADSINSDTSKSWTLTDVKKWIKRAEIALGICTWLEQYTSGGLVNM